MEHLKRKKIKKKFERSDGKSTREERWEEISKESNREAGGRGAQRR
jgi:hypothetical protein